MDGITCFNTTFVTVLLKYNMLHNNKNLCFNTTFVTVLYNGNCQGGVCCWCFNTTFVTVLFTAKKVQKRTYGFQYNFCYCSISRCFKCLIKGSVSIQLLLLFYWWEHLELPCCHPVSIQLLLLFYKGNRTVLRSCYIVSIQLLLLFYSDGKPSAYYSQSFQYNFCYCSIRNYFKVNTERDRFNTTFVTVLSAFLLVSYFGSMSILWAQKVELFSQHNICRENYFLGC